MGADLSIYFQPVDHRKSDFAKNALGAKLKVHSEEAGFPDLEEIDLAIVGVKEDRRAVNNMGCSGAPDMVRKYLYQLFEGPYKVKMADLGNVLPGETEEDTYFALSSTIAELIKKNVVPIIIGGSQDLTYANYLAYENLEQVINLVTIDNRFDMGDPDGAIDSRSYLNKIILHQPNYLFNFANLGYQTYFVDQEELSLLHKLYFDTHRLGEVRANMREVEPVVRNADVMSFDVSAIRNSDAPGNENATPNGFYGEEACQITRYAGISDKLSSIGFYEINPLYDKEEQTVHLVAQMIWYFMDGYYSRKRDFPIRNHRDYFKYRITVPENTNELVFYKSMKSDRWWMDVPYPTNKRMRYQRHHLVPCSYADYQVACNREVPDKWWKTFSKLS